MVHTCMQGTLWDLVARSVPWDVQPPAEGKLSAHETLARTVLLLLLASPGIPTLPQDVMEDERHLSTLAQCLAFRKAYAAHLTPPSFDPERAVQWHGAAPGVVLPKAHGNSISLIARLRQMLCLCAQARRRTSHVGWAGCAELPCLLACHDRPASVCHARCFLSVTCSQQC